MNKKIMLSHIVTGILLSQFSLLANENAIGLDEISVTTGTLTESLIKEVPSAIEVFTSEDIEKIGAIDLKDVLRKAQNVQTQSQRGGINIRGFGSNYTIILINGRRVSGVDANKDTLSFIADTININNIERVEILRGQAGALYGSNAIGGVINIITKKSAEEGSALFLSAGNEGIKASATFNTGKIDDFDMTVSASMYEIYGIKNDIFPTGTGKTKGSTINLSFDAGYQLAKNHEIRWFGEYANDEGRTQSEGVTSRGGIVDTETPAQKRRVSTNFVYTGSDGEAQNWTVGTQYSQSQNYLYEDDTKKFSPSFIERFELYGLDGKYSVAANDWNLITVGAELINQTTSQPSAIFGDNLANFSLYAQDEIILLDDTLFLTPTVRYDHYFDSFGGNFTPSIGLTYAFLENHRIKTSVGRGFKAPTIAELYGRETRGTGGTGILSAGKGYYVFGNKDLKPEHSTNFDIRYETEFSDSANASIGYYFSDITDKISTIDSGIPNPISGKNDKLAINIGEARVQGIEAAFKMDFNDYFGISLDYNYIDAKDTETNERLSNTAEHISGLALDFTYPNASVNGLIWVNYNKNFYDGENEFDFFTTNATILKEFKNKYTISFSVYNFLQTDETEKNNSALDPLEWRISFAMKF